MAANQDRSSIDDEAAAWVAKVDRGTLSSADELRLGVWMDEDPRHRGAFVRATAVYRHLDRAASLGQSCSLMGGEDSPEAPRAPRGLWAAAAGIAAALVLAILMSLHPFTEGPEDLASNPGERRHLHLEDGSELTLSAASRAKVRIDSQRRELELIEGEILLDVARDTARPFQVRSGDTLIKVKGTRFGVTKRHGKSVEVVVLSGEVELLTTRPGQFEAPAPIVLRANSRAISRIDFGTTVEDLESGEASRRLRWVDGMLEFNGETLGEASEIFARHSPIRILIADPEVAGRRVVGLFATDDPVGFAQAVAISFGLSANEASGAVVLSLASD